MRRAVLLAVLLALSAASARADDSASDPTVSIALQGATTTDTSNTYIGSRTPVFQVQLKYAGPSVQCRLDDAADGPCGTDQPDGCPAVRCWTFTPTAASDGMHTMTVDYDVPDGIPGSLQLPFNIDTTPPDTTLDTPPSPDDKLLPNLVTSSRRPVFNFGATDDVLNGLDSFQCAISAASAAAPGPWQPCAPGAALAKLSLAGTYRFQVRAVDLLGRVDPSAPEYVFSPQPCRPHLVGHVHSLRAIVRHGLAVRVSCIEPLAYLVTLQLPLRLVTRLHLPAQTLAVTSRRTHSQGETQTFRMRTLRGLPKILFAIAHLRMDLTAQGNSPGATDTGYGAPATLRDILRR